MKPRPRIRRLFSFGWILFHLLSFGCATAMILLGRWQLHVSEADGYPLQNTSYVAQWWLFAAFTLVLWARVVRDTLRKTPPPDRSTAGTLALRTGAQPPARGGRAMLSTQDKNGVATVYRGYHLPDSSQVLVPSHGDPMHDAYNDYLWQLALSDGEDLPSATPAPAPESTSYADYDVPEIEARRRELGPDAG